MRRLLPYAIAFLSITGPILGQDAGTPPTDAADAPTPVDHGVSKDALTLSLDPLTKDQLDELAEAWRAEVQKTSQKIADMEIAALAEDEKVPDPDQELPGLRERKGALIQRTELVADALDLKGGNTETLRKYLGAVKGIKTGVTDVSSRVQILQSWLTSPDGGIEAAKSVVKFIVILVVFWIVSAIASKVIRRGLDKQPQVSGLMKNFINKISRRVILLVGLVVALGSLGVDVGAALALIGGGAFVLAFALQDTLSNFAAGVMLLIYRPFDVGDAVELGDVSALVDSVSLVSTTIRTFDNKKVLVPNKKVWGETITNITGMPTRRVDMVFGIGYGDDADKAQEILERIISEHELVLEIPEPAIHLHELADSSVNFICRPWVKTSDVWSVYWAVTKRVKKEFDAAGISIPYPQRDVHVHTIPSGKGAEQSS